MEASTIVTILLSVVIILICTYVLMRDEEEY